MLYTVGRKDVYEPLFAEHPDGFDKLAGGSVWPTEAVARQYLERWGLSESFGVYGINANWTTDTCLEEGCEYRSLTRDAKCVPLVQHGVKQRQLTVLFNEHEEDLALVEP
ncbi:MAG: hypothetical protein JSS66_06245 [Armatimonadetes bacterium]|nr:hypothetical protein [Armatimonadota bacterium]